ncbi:MAG TPA: helix-turn-helix domain-containing protein [Dehalococcoidia bacterium]
MDDKLLLTIPEAAQRVGLGRSKLYELIQAGDVPVVRIGRAVRISAERLREWTEKLEREQA